ncbi:MAG: radical SAM protein [Thermodesulfobacteriota bacterium]
MLCPRECGVDRTGAVSGGRLGVCGEGDCMRVAWVGPHFGEEPPISGENGSGTVFFTGCPLRCVFCQNHQVSREGLGTEATVEGLVELVIGMDREAGVHNVNFVTPDHFFPHTVSVVDRLRKNGVDMPVVYNLSGYQSVNMLRHVEDAADIYLPDYKYADSLLAARYSSCPDYPGKALDAISEMLRQKGPLDVFETGAATAQKGVLVRHLILPGHVQNSLDALTALFLEFGAGLPLSLMSQYCPVPGPLPDNLKRRVQPEEFDRVYAHALDLGFHRLFVQFPEESGDSADPSPFFPDFLSALPFKGDRRSC